MKVKKHHMRQEVQNDDLHLFASNLIKNRIDFKDLPNDKPLGKISNLRVSQLVPNKEEWEHFSASCQILIARVLIEHFPALKPFANVYPTHVQHEFSEFTKKKSEIVTMPIIDADESKYQDCVKILRTYEKWIWQLHRKAGIVTEEMPDIDSSDSPLINMPILVNRLVKLSFQMMTP